jgi:bifunctional ADP-heptose synthase (sugar kinase/adenylyltransferase)
LRRVAGVRLVVLGDFAVDAYWDLDAGDAPRSVETGRPVQVVVDQRYGLGGAGNVAANAAALGARVVPVGRCGDDPFGQALRAQLETLGLDSGRLRTLPAPWQTVAYVKPHRAGVEQDRTDLGARNALDDAGRSHLLEDLDGALAGCAGAVVNQQHLPGLADPAALSAIDARAASRPERVFLVDSRDYASACGRCARKVNGHEALALLGEARDPRRPVAVEEASEAARRLAADGPAPLFVTLGAAGMLVACAGDVQAIPAALAPGPVDPVGAGDTVAAVLGACLAAGCAPLLAAQVASLAAGVTVRKLRTTGTATPEELLALAGELR